MFTSTIALRKAGTPRACLASTGGRRRLDWLVPVIVSLALYATACAAVNAEPRADEAPDACEPDRLQVRVTIANVGEGGLLTVELYDDPDNFLKRKGRKRRIRLPAEGPEARVCFNLDEQGVYAVAAYHDVDANRKLQKRWNGMPAEPFGLSNNPEPRFGFPKFSRSAFNTDALGADIDIRLITP